jgi:saccharopepsin
MKDGVVLSYKYAYAGNMTLGWPNVMDFSVLFDTGSGHVVVPSVRCTSPSCAMHRSYNVSQSPSGYSVNSDGTPRTDRVHEVEVSFGTGEISGDFARDVVCVGLTGAELLAAQTAGLPPRRACTELSMITATTMSDNPFSQFSFDGIFGLGLKSLAVNPVFSFTHTFGASSQAPSIFGMYIAGGDKERGHELAIGGYNAARVQGPLSWTPLLDAELGYWQVELRGVRVGDEDAGIDCSEGACHAIVDTGSSHFGLPKTHMRGIWEQLSSLPGDAADCRDTSTLPLHLDFDGFSLTLETKDYMRKLPTKNKVPDPVSGELASVCRPRLMPVSMPEEFGKHVFILGEPVLQRYYAAFDHGAHRVGFGLAQRDAEEESDVVLMVQVTMRVGAVQTGLRGAARATMAVQMGLGARTVGGVARIARAGILGSTHGTNLLA